LRAVSSAALIMARLRTFMTRTSALWKVRSAAGGSARVAEPALAEPADVRIRSATANRRRQRQRQRQANGGNVT